MKASEINVHCKEGELLVAATDVIMRLSAGTLDISFFKGKLADEVLEDLGAIVYALKEGR